jgi:hypothetical protein
LNPPPKRELDVDVVGAAAAAAPVVFVVALLLKMFGVAPNKLPDPDDPIPNSPPVPVPAVVPSPKMPPGLAED